MTKENRHLFILLNHTAKVFYKCKNDTGTQSLMAEQGIRIRNEIDFGKQKLTKEDRAFLKSMNLVKPFIEELKAYESKKKKEKATAKKEISRLEKLNQSVLESFDSWGS